MVPYWLHALAGAMLVAGPACASLIVIDETRHPQHMWIMNLVWPLTALFGTAAVLWFYFAHGRAGSHDKRHEHEEASSPPCFPVIVAKGTAHCGAGCTLGDIAAEWLAYAVPGIAVWFGWRSIFTDKTFAVWIVDYLFAFGFGILFQYFSIAPMRGLSLWPGLRAALKADALSLTAWQVGMYGFMALAQFYLFRSLLGARLDVATPEYWFMMQLAMMAGFATAYPVNWWLIRTGIKEKM